jgi:hypothetical protein
MPTTLDRELATVVKLLYGKIRNICIPSMEMKGENMGFFSKQTMTKQNERYEQKNRERVAKITRLGEEKMHHYLTSPFTAQCVAILKEEIAAGRILQNKDHPIKVDYRGVVSGPLGYPRLISFNDYGYNNFTNGAQVYGFLFAICTLLGSDYKIEFGIHPYYDTIEPYIVKRKTQQYRDI